jgi:hypothetical protein
MEVEPDNASDQTITWSVKTDGGTGATFNENVLTATALGDVTVTATIANGTAVGTPVTVERTVRVKGPLVAHGDFVTRNILGGVELAEYIGNDASVTIPGDLGITVVGNCFWGQNRSSIVVPEGVTEVTFSECFYLTSVTLPQSLQVIENVNSTALPSITIPSGVTTIGAFSSCFSLTSMTVEAAIPPTVREKWDGSNALFVGDLPIGLTAIYVPAASVGDYKAAPGWSDYASIITAIIP